MLNLKSYEEYCGSSAPGMHGDHVAGGDAVHVPGGHGSDHKTRHTEEVEGEVEKPGTSRGATIVKYVHQYGCKIRRLWIIMHYEL